MGPPKDQVRGAVERHCQYWNERNEAAVLMRNEGNLHGREVVVESIEVWKVGADGLVRAVRAYFEPDADVQSDYFTPT
jgi:hypothetical protein